MSFFMSSYFIAHGIETWDNHHWDLSVTGIGLQFCSVVVLMIRRLGYRKNIFFSSPSFWLFGTLGTWQRDGTAGSTLSDNGLGGTRLA